jgi:ABC-type uncharacterized transport system permease subunit
VINILAVGVTGFLRNNVILDAAARRDGKLAAVIPVPVLSNIPTSGLACSITSRRLSNADPRTLMSLLLFRTPWGLRTRAIASTQGGGYYGQQRQPMRYMNVFFLSGLMAGWAGAWSR